MPISPAKEILVWEKIVGDCIIQNGEPSWKCPRCKFVHIYGMNTFGYPLSVCPYCKSRLVYPWQKIEDYGKET